MTYSIGFPSDGLPNRGWKLYIASLVMVLVAGVLVIARCAVRIRGRQMGADDYTILLSMAVSIYLSVAIQTAITYGYGQPKINLSTAELHQALMWFYLAQTPYKIVVGLNKTSVVLFCKRIFVTRRFSIICWIVIAIVASWTIGTVLATIFQCVPIRGSWDKSVDAYCVDQDSFWVAYAVSNVLTDVLVLAIPIPEIFKLHLTMRQRLSLCGVFLLGGFVVVCGIMRTTSVSNSLDTKSDVTYNFITRGIWTLVEANMGIMCACLPLLYRPFSNWFSRTVNATFEMSGLKSATTGRNVGTAQNGRRADQARREEEDSKSGTHIMEDVERLYPVDEPEGRASTVKSHGYG